MKKYNNSPLEEMLCDQKWCCRFCRSSIPSNRMSLTENNTNIAYKEENRTFVS